MQLGQTSLTDWSVVQQCKNIQMLNIRLSNHQALLTIFPTLLSIIWYIYPPTRSVLLSVLDVIAVTERKELVC
jgi:hypothetical protein